MRKLTHNELLARQVQLRSEPKIPVTVVVNDVRSLYNVGSIFRTADGVGVEEIWLCGITGFPPDKKISKTALGAEETVAWGECANVLTVVSSLKQKGYTIVLLEQLEESIAFERFTPRGPVALVLGNEISGVSDELLTLCDVAVDIEMVGLKNSLNVSVAFGIVAYHVRNQLMLSTTAIGR